MDAVFDPLTAPRSLTYAIPLLFGLTALLAGRDDPLRLAERVTGLSLLLAIAGACARVVADDPAIDVVTGVVLLLVCAMGAVIARFSRTYLLGDPGVHRYARFLLATLGSVALLVLARNLFVLAAAWISTSLSLHQLLTFYPDRPAALVAAHKKFLASRIADLALLSAVALIHSVVGTADIDAVLAWARAHPELPGRLHAAAVLLVLAAALKSAQVPFHGWLTQVMEAPTPVSALLHAGVVNLGGFLMIRMAPLMAKAEAAQLLLVVIGTTTAVVAGLVTSTRVSVKVALAWSTCAQMGFMLAECGLGAWDLALLHLVAHSLYKGHAFLSSGGRVDAWRAGVLGPRVGDPSPMQLLTGSVAALAVVATLCSFATLVTGDNPVRSAEGLAITFLLALALTPLVARGVALQGEALLGVVLRAAGFGVVYVVSHALARSLLPPPAHSGVAGALILASGFSILFVLHAVLAARPGSRLARALHPRLFAGLHLDELFTRVTFRLWPPRMPGPRASNHPLSAPDTVEV